MERGEPRETVRVKHLADARELLNQNGGRYPGAAEMLKSGHGALYQFMLKYPHDFQLLVSENSASSGKTPVRHRRRRIF